MPTPTVKWWYVETSAPPSETPIASVDLVSISLSEGTPAIDASDSSLISVSEAFGVISESTTQDVSLLSTDSAPGATEGFQLEVTLSSSDQISGAVQYVNTISASLNASENIAVVLGETASDLSVTIVASDAIDASSITEFRDLLAELVTGDSLVIALGETALKTTGFLVSYYDFNDQMWKPCVLRIYDFGQEAWIQPIINIYENGAWTDGSN